MTNGNVNLEHLADELAAIAKSTTDPETARRLTEVVKRLLEAAGLPPGGGDTPP
jgi:hypothetical protein